MLSPDFTPDTCRLGDVFQRLRPNVFESSVDLAANLIVDGRRDAYAAWLGYAFKASCDIHAVAENIVRLDDDVAYVDAHTKKKAPVFRVIVLKCANGALKAHSSPNSLDRARKLRQEPIPGVLHDAAAVFGNCWINGVREERAQFGMRSLSSLCMSRE